MIPTFKISFNLVGPDLDDLAEQLEEKFDASMELFGDKVADYWKQLADQKLKTSKEVYKAGISYMKTQDGVEFHLKGWLPVAVEKGYPAFNMLENLLQGRTSRVIPLGQRRDFGKPAESYRVAHKNQTTLWKHPGVPARHLLDDVEKEIPNIIDEVFGDVVDQIQIKTKEYK